MPLEELIEKRPPTLEERPYETELPVASASLAEAVIPTVVPTCELSIGCQIVSKSMIPETEDSFEFTKQYWRRNL